MRVTPGPSRCAGEPAEGGARSWLYFGPKDDQDKSSRPPKGKGRVRRRQHSERVKLSSLRSKLERVRRPDDVANESSD
jgi:hypothetical protein